MAIFKRQTTRGETDFYHYRFMLQNKRYTGVCDECTTKSQALQFEKDLKDSITKILNKEDDVKSIAREFIQTKTGSKTISLKKAFSEYLKQPSPNKSSDRHTQTKESYWNDFLAFITEKYPDLKNMDEIKSVHVTEYLGYIQNNGRYCKKINYSTSKFSVQYETKTNKISNRTYNFIFGVLKEIFTRLAKPAGILIDPFENLQKMGKDQVTRDVFTEEELKLIAKEADDFIYPIFAIGLNTAFREGDICTLKWSDINFEAEYIQKRTRKTGTDVLIPLLPSLKGYLLKLKGTGGESPYVLPKHAEIYLTNPSGINYRVKKFLHAIGIETQKKVKGRTRQASTKDVHSLRHTFCYQAGLKKIPLLVVKDICGHMTAEMNQLYKKHATMEAKREQLRLLQGAIDFLPEIEDSQESKRERLKNRIDGFSDKEIDQLTKVAEKFTKK